MTDGSLPADVVEVDRVGMPPSGLVLEPVSVVEVKGGVMVPSGIRGVKFVVVEGVPDAVGTVVVGVEYVRAGSLVNPPWVEDATVHGQVVVVNVSQCVTVKVAV